MEVLLGFIAVTFVAGARAASGTRAPSRRLLLVLALLVGVALLSHRLA